MSGTGRQYGIGIRALMLAVLVVGGLWLAGTASPAQAAVGDLSLERCYGGELVEGCITVSELEQPIDIEVTGDGSSLYSTANNEDDLLSFSRDPDSGNLTYSECYRTTDGSPSCAVPLGPPPDPRASLITSTGLFPSPDGSSIYVTGGEEVVLHHFSRNASTGALSLVECHTSNAAFYAGCRQWAGNALGGGELNLAFDISDDGRHIYLGTEDGDDMILFFSRDLATGAVELEQCFAQAADPLPDPCVELPQFEAEVDGGLALTGDGGALAVGTLGQIDSALFFDRNENTGRLEFRECFSETPTEFADPEVEECSQAGIEGSFGSMLTSGDGKSIYLSSNSAVNRFDRDPVSGDITFRGCVGDLTAANCTLLSDFGGGSGMVAGDDRSVLITSGAVLTNFDRNPATGALTRRGCLVQGGSDACASVNTVFAPISVTAGPDSETVYVASPAQDAIHQFSREALSQVDPTDPDGSVEGIDIDVKKKQRIGGQPKVKSSISANAEEVTAVAKGSIKVVGKGKKRVGASAKKIKLKKAKGTIGAGSRTILRQKLKGSKKQVKKTTRKLKKALAKGKKVRANISLKITDEAGNKLTAKRTVQFKK